MKKETVVCKDEKTNTFWCVIITLQRHQHNRWKQEGARDNVTNIRHALQVVPTAPWILMDLHP